MNRNDVVHHSAGEFAASITAKSWIQLDEKRDGCRKVVLLKQNAMKFLFPNRFKGARRWCAA